MVSVRNDGNSLSAIAHRLIAPRTRTILLVFIFFYLLLVAGAFGNIVVGVLFGQPQVPLAIVTLVVMGILGGQMLYRWKTDLILMSLITVGITLLIIIVGPLGMQVNPPATQGAAPQIVQGPVGQLMVGLNTAVNSITGGAPVITYYDPTLPLPPNTPPGVAVANVNITPAFLFWLLGLCVFSYLGAILPIWRLAQPVNYIGFWITFLTMVLAGLGAAMAVLLKPEVAALTIPAIKSADLGFMMEAGKGWQPLWPMLFVTIACGAISGWHALIGSVGTARQIENETDMLPVGGGAMFSEFALGLLSLLALATAAQPAAGAAMFAAGIGGFLSVFAIPVPYGTAIGFAAFVVIVITVVQLVFRVMRVTLAEGLGDRNPIFRNIHVGTLISMAATFLLVITGTWVYIWQLFGAANQLMASLSLLVVTVWLAASRRNPMYAAIPTVFMYITTMAATLVTAYNLYATVFARQIGQPGREIAVIGSLLTIAIALVLFVAAIMIGIDGYRAYQRYREQPLEPVPAPASA